MKDKKTVLIFGAIATALTIAVVIAWNIPEKKENEMIPIEEIREKEPEVNWDEIEIVEIEIEEIEVQEEKQHKASDKIALKPELQIFTHEKCDEYGVSYPLILALMESESTFLEEVGNERILGGKEGEARYYGYMQLSSGNVHKAKMEYDLDAHTPEGNIEMAIILMAKYKIKYNEPTAELTAYKAGEGAADMGVRLNFERILRKAEDFERIIREEE